MQSFTELYAYVATLPDWLSHLIVAVVMVYTVCIAGVVLLKAGRHPVLALALFLPYAGVIGLWWLAYVRWPRQEIASPESQNS